MPINGVSSTDSLEASLTQLVDTTEQYITDLGNQVNESLDAILQDIASSMPCNLAETGMQDMFDTAMGSVADTSFQDMFQSTVGQSSGSSISDMFEGLTSTSSSSALDDFFNFTSADQTNTNFGSVAEDILEATSQQSDGFENDSNGNTRRIGMPVTGAESTQLTDVVSNVNDSTAVDLDGFRDAMNGTIGLSLEGNKISAETNAALMLFNRIGDAYNKLR
jgi:hypothetical protein